MDEFTRITKRKRNTPFEMWCFLQREPHEVSLLLFKKTYLGVLDFQNDFCQHLTIPEQVTAVF